MNHPDPQAEGWDPMRDNDLPASIGTPFAKQFPDGWRYALRTRPDHANPAGAVHGGVLMCFADHVLGLYVETAADGAPNVTIQLNTHFLSAVKPGDFIVLRGEVTRASGTLVFVRGIISVDDRDAVALDGIWRVFRPKKQ